MHALRSIVALLLIALPALAADPRVACLKTSGREATTCLAAYLRAPVDDVTSLFDEAAVRAACPEETSIALGYLGADDTVLRLRDACKDFGADFVDIENALTPAPGSPEARCQSIAASEFGTLRAKTIVLFGKACFLREAKGGKCRRPVRDAKATALRKQTTKHLTKRCHGGFDALGLGNVDDVVGRVFDRARHFAQFVYPPNDLGPTAEVGPYPVGVRTLELADPSRTDVTGTGARPVTVELWYPSTPEAVAGKERYVVNLFGFDIAKTPTYRDVARAPGPFPLVLFSHGNAGIRFQSIFLAAHLASHGYVVASPDHRGNTFIDIAGGIIDPLASSAMNRPLDMTFLLDQLLAMNAVPTDFLAGAIDPSEVGMSGHSFGGYTTFALAGGMFPGGTFTDARMKAFLPLAPASSLFPDDFFPSITKPILVVGGTLDVTTPFATEQLRAFQLLPAGAPIVGLAEITGAGHFTFSDVCEVPRNLVAAIGGFGEACTPQHLPWRDAHDLIDYLALNFFDATLKGDAEAGGRLAPSVLASLDDLDYQNK